MVFYFQVGLLIRWFPVKKYVDGGTDFCYSKKQKQSLFRLTGDINRKRKTIVLREVSHQVAKRSEAISCRS
jgi:hypothetical protein